MNRATFESFVQSLSQNEPAQKLAPLLQALWWDAKGNWSKAHEIAQEISSAEASWIHAYLHRKEGDLANADYWYLHAGRKRPAVSLDEEWKQISAEILERQRDESDSN